MSERYILMKRSRIPAMDIARESDAYMGGSCEDAGIAPDKVYGTFEEAAADALALRRVNEVGWCVWRVGESFPIASTERYNRGRGREVIWLEQGEGG